MTYTNRNITSPAMAMKVYYYKKFRGKTIKIMCLEDALLPSQNINLIPVQIYNSLKSTKRINDSLFVLDLTYNKQYANNPVEVCDKKFYFRFVSDRQYDMYKKIEEDNKKLVEETKIFRPKKQDN